MFSLESGIRKKVSSVGSQILSRAVAAVTDFDVSFIFLFLKAVAVW